MRYKTKNKIADLIFKYISWKFKHRFGYGTLATIFFAASFSYFGTPIINVLLPFIEYVYLKLSGDQISLLVYVDTVSIAVYIGLFIAGSAFAYMAIRNKKLLRKTIHLLKHSSMFKVSFPSNDRLERNYKIVDSETLDLTEYIKPDTLDSTLIIKCIKEQDRLIESINFNSNSSTFAYMGIAHIPLVARMGYQIGDENNYIMFENRKTSNNGFHPLIYGCFFPKLILIDKITNSNSEELIITIGVTFPVKDHEVPFDLNNYNVLKFELQGLKTLGQYHDIITSNNQLDNYRELIRTEKDIAIKETMIKKIHIFCAAPTSLVFTIGSMISDTHDPDVIIYHYIHSNAPNYYPWGIDLKEKNSSNSYINLSKL